MTDYTGNCIITQMVWAGNGVELSENDDSTWLWIRDALLGEVFNGDTDSHIEYLVAQMMDDEFPLLKLNCNNLIYSQVWNRGGWQQFVRSWAEVLHCLDGSHIEGVCNAEEMAEVVEEHNLEVVPNETVDEFNERIWNMQVEDKMVQFEDDFDALRCAIEAASLLSREVAA